MRIAVAADHAGFAAKERIADELARLGHSVRDFGTDSEKSCDYPDYAIPAARSVAEGESERAILVCANGIGMGMTANRVPGVRAAVVYSERTAATTRGHHDSNVLCLGAREFPLEELLAFVRVWLEAPFEGGRHVPRVAKFEALDGG